MQTNLFGNPVLDSAAKTKKPRGSSKEEKEESLPENLGKAQRMPVPDFSDPNRKASCLEIDFPIAQINALSQLEGNAGKPIYQMSKWWARRRSSVFRSLLISAATEAPADKTQAAKVVWQNYYANHQKAGSFKKLRVLDCFMGGGTTLVEGSRLGMSMTGVDLNPVAWFVVKNELACSDPEQVRAFFVEIEKQVKPRIQPFYATSCPRGHKGRWVDVASGKTVKVDPADLPVDQRANYRWEGPEIIYVFWAKHGHCSARGCGHRTPIFRSSVIAEKKLSADFLELTCPKCATLFHAELGETRMAPGTPRVVLESETAFTELSQPFAQFLSGYDKGGSEETIKRTASLRDKLQDEPGLCCPKCRTFSARRFSEIVERHAKPGTKAGERKKKDFGIRSKPVRMHLLIHPEWMKGASGSKSERELGGWAGAPIPETGDWNKQRIKNCKVVEIRGAILPDTIDCGEGLILKPEAGSVPRRAHFTCAACGRENNTLEATRATSHTAPVAVYTLQCHCPQCDTEGFNYGGRFFKAPDAEDIQRLDKAEAEWAKRAEGDLKEYWPRQECWDAYMMRANGGVNEGWGYTHWWKMFNSRQLLVHTHLLQAIMDSPDHGWPLDIREQALGAFQQYLRMMCMFSFWHQTYDKLAPALSNSNFHPKNLVVETSAFGALGYGRWPSCQETIIDAMEWCQNPWELEAATTGTAKSRKLFPQDPLIPGGHLVCSSSTDLTHLGDSKFDLVITDPPFGNNLFYADLADFFYVWLRIPLRKWYAGTPEQAYFEPERTPHSMEAVDNKVEHPDDREGHETEPFIPEKQLERIRELSGDATLEANAPNPLYRPEPASDFYSQTLAGCWGEAGRLLKPGGIMAFTFHHAEDASWVDVLKALFDSGYLLVATYPIRSDEIKGESAAFGSRTIEYDIIHVCRKRLEKPEPVSWARMRRWVKEEARQLKTLLEHTHGKELPESDLRVVLRGKSLEFFSRHYGQVFTGDGQVLDVRDALLGINQILEDLLEEAVPGTVSLRPPESAEPASRLFLRLFRDKQEMERDELHKSLRGTGISPADLEAHGWVRTAGRSVHAVPVRDRFLFLSAPGRTRKVIKTDLDQAFFLIGAAMSGSGLKIEAELDNPNFRIKKSTDDILTWYAQTDISGDTRQAALTAAQLVEHWRSRPQRTESRQPTLFDQLEEAA